MSEERASGASSMRLASLGTKLASATIVVLAIVACGTYLEVSRTQRESLLHAKELAASMVGGLFSAGLAAPLAFGDDKGAEEQVGLLTINDQVIYGAAWSIDPADPARPAQKLGELRRPAFTGQPTPPVGDVHRELRTVRDGNWVFVEAPVIDPRGKPLGVAQVVLSLAEENAAILRTQHRTLFFSLATALGVSLVLLALSRALIVRPLARLASAARRLENGEAVEVAVQSNDEVGELARAFATMARAIATREERISERNRDMRRVLDSVEEGFLTVDRSGAMSHERSRILDVWFSAPPPSGSFLEYVDAIAPQSSAFMRLGWRALLDNFLPLEVVLDQLPRRFSKDGRYFVVDYRPIGDGPDPEQILVVIRDATAEMERERAEEGQREMATLVRRMLADRTGFDDFVQEAARLVTSIDTSAPADFASILRAVHTLKGNMGLFEIDSLATFCHRLEQRMLDETTLPTAAEKQDLRSRWNAIESVLEQLAGARPHGIDLDLDEHRMLLDALEDKVDPAIIRSVVDSWRHERAATRLERVADHVRALAKRLGKCDLEVTATVTPVGLRLPPQRWAPFWTVFAHVVRNTVDHGLEDATARELSGKPPRAKVTLDLDATGDSVRLQISDDGRGIDWAKLRERAAAAGLPCETPADLEEALYADGVSSAEESSEISGRGVGMGAVRELVRALGGRIEVRTAPGRGTTFGFVFPRATRLARASQLPPVYAGILETGRQGAARGAA